MDKVVYQNQNKGKLFKNNSGGSVQTELAATGNILMQIKTNTKLH